MSFFSDERASELRELFFESATELLQNLNEEGLELEKHPGDPEIIRQVRRTVHTLKGDSAACGYQELSELAHQLEDVLTAEMAESANGSIADVVLIAADTFSSMLSAYRGNMQAPAGEELRQQIMSLAQKPVPTNGGNGGPYKLHARFAWSEYEHMVMEDALGRGETVFNIAFAFEQNCPMRGAAMQLVRNVLQECGRLLAIVPDQSTLTNDLDVVEAAIATAHDQEWIEKKCRIPSVVSSLLVEQCVFNGDGSDDVLDIVKHVTAELVEDVEPQIRAEEIIAPVAPPSTTPKNFQNGPGSGHPQNGAPAAATTQPSPKPPASVPAAAVPAEAQTGLSSIPETLLRVDAERIDAVLNLVGELIIGKSMMHQSVNEFDKRFPKDPLRMKFADAMAFQSRIINDLQKSVMKIRMVPVEQLFRRFPRVVRDVAKSCGKDVTLVMSGQDTDLDKSILDMLAEPLAHLVRNAVDHGIESAPERINGGKPAQGTVRLDAYHQGNQIVIEVADDGRGIDRDKLLRKAVEQGIIKAADAQSLSDSDASNLVFHPGLSTAEQVTAISGRGMGMDIVKTVLERLKGTVSIRTSPGKGTTFLLKVPLTLAIIKALLFRVGQRTYAVPLASVIEIARATPNDIHVVDHHDVLQLRHEILTLVHLSKIANQPAAGKRMFIVVISMGDRKFGLVVDRLVGEEELVIKALDDNLVATDLVSGASILGDGTVVLILNIASIISRMGRMHKMIGATA
ncbi:MAG TPA: chemotaxis protein CheA [Candidatus Angelobacter sp.]|nr:chemotaxis protein CheA [Candidatus Angelobacter sp.]